MKIIDDKKQTNMNEDKASDRKYQIDNKEVDRDTFYDTVVNDDFSNQDMLDLENGKSISKNDKNFEIIKEEYFFNVREHEDAKDIEAAAFTVENIQDKLDTIITELYNDKNRTAEDISYYTKEFKHILQLVEEI